jgi:hypothetical protein
MAEDPSEPEEADVVDEGREAGSSTPAPVIVGLEPTAGGPSDGGTVESKQLDAVLLSMASGARGLTLAVDWADLQGAGAAQVWSRIVAIGSLLRAQKRALLLSIRAVNATLDARPDDLKGKPWGEGSVISEMHALIDELFEAMGAELRYLSVGFEVDRYATNDMVQRAAFVAFAADAVRYANTRPNRPQNLQAAVTWSHDAWLGGEPPKSWAGELVSASDVVMVSYTPIGDDLRARPADSAHGDVPLMLQAIGERSLVFASVGYPSSALIGSSEQNQAEFFRLLFKEVVDARSHIPFAAVGRLHDPAPEECLSKASAQGHAGSAELYAYWCSTGLRTREGNTKQAFDAFRGGAALLLEP